jgi:nucleoside-diphosphate-sugar epimerase
MVANLMSCFEEAQPHWIFMSSVSVYGNEYTKNPMEISLNPLPVDDYGSGKLNDENLLRSKCKNLDILRLPPVYDDINLNDIKKRVFIPYINKKILITPAPLYTLCHKSKISDFVKKSLYSPGIGQRIVHLGNPESIDQNEVSKWFDGKGIRIPKIIFSLLFHILPKRLYFFKSIAYMIKKLGLNNTFRVGEKVLD